MLELGCGDGRLSVGNRDLQLIRPDLVVEVNGQTICEIDGVPPFGDGEADPT